MNGAPTLVHPKDEPPRDGSPATTFGLVVSGKAATSKDATISAW